MSLNTSHEWVHELEAAKHLALKQPTLRNMRRERMLDAGTHWVDATGPIGGPVVYCIPAIREMQRQRTIKAAQEKDSARKAQLELRKQAVECCDKAEIARLVVAKGET